jgi:hypothetical protein
MVKSLRELLDEYERDILMRIDPVRKELASYERALADVRKARNAIVHGGSERLAHTMVGRLGGRPSKIVFYGGGDPWPEQSAAAPSPYAKLTMKQLVRKALDEHFANGATALELLDFFKNAWGRHDIIRSSLSPQLSRLKREGVIRLEGKTWHLAGDGAADHDDDNEPLLLTAPQEKREPI